MCGVKRSCTPVYFHECTASHDQVQFDLMSGSLQVLHCPDHCNSAVIYVTAPCRAFGSSVLSLNSIPSTAS